jgi:quercetin dioxygenase-like cupin family protein
MTHFSSKDFSKTKGGIEVNVPEKLSHRDVISGREDKAFSRERKHFVQVVDLPSKTISMTIGGLDPLQSSNRHRHTYETLIYILEGEGESQIEDRTVPWKAGDAIYVPVWAWHSHRNTRSDTRCLYLACENAPLLQNLGGVAIREEG